MRTLAKLAKAKVFRRASWGIVITMTLGLSCSDPGSQESEMPASPEAPANEDPGSPTAEPQPELEDAMTADVTAVRVRGAPGAYTFSVTLSSPDTGCDQYADWWEVITTDGELVYRRILAHSHVNEQPFTRSGGPVELQETTQAIVRAHKNNAGYGGVAFSGSPASEFTADPSVSSALAPQLADAAPQPDGCAF
ncbi:MAG: hypothetical protein JRJ80_15235 [Deltaproteobacteria bacterium]|jgi:hypothetical protein|nr:hypothetical protein [Deltaproteobacteria bacterium]